MDYVVDGLLLDYSRLGGAIRGKWRILDGKGDSMMVHKFEAPRMVAPACLRRLRTALVEPLGTSI
jgi:hypothetical protein